MKDGYRLAMTNIEPHTHATSLATLVDGLVAYLKDRAGTHASPSDSRPDGLARVFDSFGHHLIALMLVARSDDDVAAKERDVIQRHCIARARNAGIDTTDDEEAALKNLLRHFRPTMQHVTLMLEGLKHDTKDDIAGLVAAAHAVVQADGAVRFQEMAYLASLQHDLLALEHA